VRTRRNILQNIDWISLSLYGVMVFLGWLNIYAATYNEEHQSILDLSQSYGKQLMWIGTSVIIAMAIMLLDHNFFDSFAYYIYGIGVFALMAVLVVGSEIKGAKSWFVLGGFSLQPSEFAKYGTALGLTKFLHLYRNKFQKTSIKLQATAIFLIPAALIMLQPDTGSTLVYCAFVFVLYREGLSGNFLLLGLAAAAFFILALLLKDTFIDLPFGLIASGKVVFITVLGLICVTIYSLFKKVKRILPVVLMAFILSVSYVLSVDYVFDNVLSTHQQDRINELLGIVSDPTGAGYNVHQSKIAIGSGGFAGKGYLQGTQTKYDFVPEQSTDFIFCTIGEEWGFLGSLLVICIFLFFLFRLVWVAERQRSDFSRIYGYCIASIFFFHFAINIGMTIGLAPVIGIPLPFFSYGGSSLWAFTLLLFTFLRMDSERKYILG